MPQAEVLRQARDYASTAVPTRKVPAADASHTVVLLAAELTTRANHHASFGFHSIVLVKLLVVGRPLSCSRCSPLYFVHQLPPFFRASASMPRRS
jgi:hypothetical protein